MALPVFILAKRTMFRSGIAGSKNGLEADSQHVSLALLSAACGDDSRN
jgi:hypothetical protein